MDITASALQALGQGFNASFLQGLQSVQQQYQLVCMTTTSKTAYENYGWLKMIPGMREWIGERVLNNLVANDYQVFNKHYEHTISVSKTDIQDDILGLYSNMFQIQGTIAAEHPDVLTWQVLQQGTSTVCMDGNYFFDIDHLSYDKNGNPVSYANFASGANPTWYLMDLSRSFMKPLVMQKRQDLEFVALMNPDDPNVFYKKEFDFGVDARYNVGFGFYQLAYASQLAISATSFAAAKLAMTTQFKPDGTVINVQPTHMLVGPTNEAAARALLKAEFISGSTNPWFNAVELVVINALG